MSNPISKLTKLETLKPQDLSCNIFSVYDYDACTIQELLCQFFNKINECVDISNATFKLAEWLVSEGLEIEVVKQLEKWLGDGTLAGIINDTIFKELNAKVDRNKVEIDKLKKFLEYNVLEYGIDNEGNEDITLKLNELIQKVFREGGGTIYFPKGNYKVLDQIIFMPYVKLKGCMSWRGKDKEGYSIFKCYSLNKAQFLLREYSSMENFMFDYPEQGTTLATLKEYEWTIKTDTTKLCDDIQLNDLYFPNSFKAMSIENAGRFNIRHVYGNPIKTGLRVHDSRDLGSIDRVEFWTFTYYVDTEIFKYIKENATAFEMGQCDGGLYSNMFSFGYNKGFHLFDETWATFVGCCSDQSRHPIMVDKCGLVEFVGGAFIADSYKGIICKINDVSGSLKLHGCNFFGNNNIGVLNKSQRGNVVVDVYFKPHDNRVKIPIINAGKEMVVRSNVQGEKIIGGVTLDGVRTVTQGGAVVVKEFRKSDFEGFGDDVTDIDSGFRVNMGKAVQGDKNIEGRFRLDDKDNIPEGMYYFEFTLEQRGTSDRKRFSFDIRKDTGKVYNTIMNEYPYVDGSTTFAVPVYLGDRDYITQIRLFLNYYDESNPTNDYIDFKFFRLVKMGEKTLNSTIENAYKYYEGDKKINYNIGG